MQLDWLNSTLSPVINGDIALSIKINTQIHKQTNLGFTSKSSSKGLRRRHQEKMLKF